MQTNADGRSNNNTTHRFEREDARKKYNRDVNEYIKTLHGRSKNVLLFFDIFEINHLYLVDE